MSLLVLLPADFECLCSLTFLPIGSPISEPWWLSSTQETLPTLLMEKEGLTARVPDTESDTEDQKLKSIKWKSPPLLGRASSYQQAGTETQHLSNSTTHTVNTGKAGEKANVP